MDYKLAQQLKDAGFPQGDGTYIYGYIGSICRRESKGEQRSGDKSCCDDYDCSWQAEEVYLPTLSELIEACGDRFDSLEKIENGWYAGTETGTNGPHGVGDTPKEAVAKLYIELNKK